MAQLAQRNGSSAKVKQFAARLVRDHQAADQKVVAIAKQLGINLPAERQGHMGRDTTVQDTTSGQGYPQTYKQRGDTTDRDGMRDHERVAEQLRTLRGPAFDTAFANAMVKGHENAVNMLEMAQGQVQHEEVRSLIASTLPTIREHLQIAQSLGGTATTTSSSQ